jgi:hypothetical protein
MEAQPMRFPHTTEEQPPNAGQASRRRRIVGRAFLGALGGAFVGALVGAIVDGVKPPSCGAWWCDQIDTPLEAVGIGIGMGFLAGVLIGVLAAVLSGRRRIFATVGIGIFGLIATIVEVKAEVWPGD